MTERLKIHLKKLKLICLGIVTLAAVTLGDMPAKAAGTWVAPEGTVNAGAAIVMDADTETVLWGSNIYELCYPASITKIMTGLLVLENCEDLDEIVEITADSVYGLESGAVTAGLSVGDKVSVRDLLYATLYRSAADSSNALALHVAGSIKDFAAMMTKRAAELGCTSTVFKNPSGLTDEEHVTTAYDLALIGKACFDNPQFMEIEAGEDWKMGPTEKYPGGLTVSVGHKMVKSGTKYTDERVVGGKTGFITASGNTLITFAEDNGRRLIVVVLKDKNPEHYEDTALLMNFGFDQFENVELPDPVAAYDVEERLKTDKIVTWADSHIEAEGPAVVTLPKGADPADVSVSFDYNCGADAPELAVARLSFRYADVKNGSVWILDDRESELELSSFTGEEEGGAGNGHGSFKMPFTAQQALIGSGVMIVILILFTLFMRHRRKVRREQERRERFRERHLKRLEEMNLTEESFHEMVEEYKHRKDPGVREAAPAADKPETRQQKGASASDAEASGPAAADTADTAEGSAPADAADNGSAGHPGEGGPADE